MSQIIKLRNENMINKIETSRSVISISTVYLNNLIISLKIAVGVPLIILAVFFFLLGASFSGIAGFFGHKIRVIYNTKKFLRINIKLFSKEFGNPVKKESENE